MFDIVRYRQNSFSIIFPDEPKIRRYANEFEDRLAGMYFAPQVLPIPDAMDPQLPRMIFGSEHGYSQIVISQTSFSLNVSYSEDYQQDSNLRLAYLRERVPILLDLLQVAGDRQPQVCGLTTLVQLRSSTEENEIEYLSRMLSQGVAENLYDVSIKTTEIIDNFFSNITYSNYRTWNLNGPPISIIPLPKDTAAEHGIQIVGDFNDRYAFNEQEDYQSTRDIGMNIIERGLQEIESKIQNMRADHE